MIFKSTFPLNEKLNGSIPGFDIFKPLPGQNIAKSGIMANTRIRMSLGHSSGTCKAIYWCHRKTIDLLISILVYILIISSTLDCTSIQLTSSTPWVKARLEFFLCGDSSFVLVGGNFHGQIYRQKRNCNEFPLKEPRYLKMTNKNTWEVSFI